MAQNVTITDAMSAGLSYIGATTNGNVAVNNVGQSTTAGTTSLAVGQTLTMVLNATVTATTGNVTNTAAGICTSTTPEFRCPRAR